MDERPRSQIVGTRASLQITGVGSETLLSLYPLHGGQGMVGLGRQRAQWETQGELMCVFLMYRDLSNIEARGRINHVSKKKRAQQPPTNLVRTVVISRNRPRDLSTCANSLTTREHVSSSPRRDVTV